MYAPSFGGGNFDLCPEGTHAAICTGVVDLGLQITNWDGKEKRQRQIMLWFETEDQGECGHYKPQSLWLTFSMHKKASLRKIMESWRGKPYSDEDAANVDFSKMLGAKCTLQVYHDVNKGGYEVAKIQTVLPPVKGQQSFDPTETPILLSMDDWDEAVFQSLPEWLAPMVREGYQRLEEDRYPAATRKPGGMSDQDLDDEIPF